MSQICDIQLERPSGVYHAGETVNGHIYLTLTERALIKAIFLESNGYASTSWDTPRKLKKAKPGSEPEARPYLHFGQRVDYFAKVDYFVGSEAALPQLMAAGAYRYDFSVQLPEGCPSSFEGAHGQIRYTLQLHVQRGGEQPTEPAYVRQLQLIGRDPSQEAQQLQQLGELPCEVSAVELRPALKFWHRPLQLHLDVPRSSYEPGMGISVHVQLHNGQQLLLQQITYKLNQVTTYLGSQQDRPKRKAQQVDRRPLISSSHQLVTCPRNELLNFQHLHTLQVPQTPPTMGANVCDCLHLGYELEVLVQTKNPQRYISARMPIIIYSAPSPKQELAFSQPVGIASAPSRTPEPNSFAMAAPQLTASMSSLPSHFREAEFMIATNLNKDKHAMSGEQMDFRPRYLYYEMDHVEVEQISRSTENMI
ncbi:arrestin domain-containing protein 17 [Drosophila mojavensis]|uniref:Arrestin C-terminal-like domain-containing protein n=1 Tax=Drosophila mojavensis TaxID=7230 RepID=B4K6T2_DROMO|nr:arrestin domain-containing protein 17 [Drosophila mojavensis]EDW14198.1 uncharacterized protein Dmoj_GI23464 [Drosophila mojavensis]